MKKLTLTASASTAPAATETRATTHLSMRALMMSMLLGAVLSGCASNKDAPATMYDLGPLRSSDGSNASVAATIPPLTVADVTTPSWLDNDNMQYRLLYENDQKPRPYASSRWNMSPPQLITQRVKTRLSDAGNTVLSAADGAVNVPVLRIEVDDFSQRFTSATASDGHVVIRASLFSGRLLVAQRKFEQQRLAPSADAAGGAVALASATDAVVDELMRWLGTIPDTAFPRIAIPFTR